MIDNNMYMHKMEKQATEILDKKLISNEYKNQLINYYRKFEEQLLLSDLVGKFVEVNEQQFGNLYYITKNLSERLGVQTPKIYIYESFYYDVSVKGLDNPWIQISAKSLEDFTEDELKFVIGRQLCHIKEDHIKYKILCEQFIKPLEMTSKLGYNFLSKIPGIQIVSREVIEMYSSSFKLRAYQWNRTSEYTADNCGYLLCGNIAACISAIKKEILNSNKLANQMNLKSFIDQCETVNMLQSSAAVYSVLDEQIPYGPFRIKELLKFASSSLTKKNLKSINTSCNLIG